MKIDGQLHCLWRAVDDEGEVLKSFVTKTREKKAALKFIKIKATTRSTARDRDRQTRLLLRCDEEHRQRRPAGNRALVEISGREFSPAISKEGASDETLLATSKFAKVRLHPRFCPQLLQLGAQPLF